MDHSLHIDQTFVAMLPVAESRVIAASRDTVYVLDRLLTIRAYNSAYARFGASNGCPQVEQVYGIGCKLVTVLPPVASNLYMPAYRQAMETGTRVDHDYECSSPRVYRRYRQTAYPLAEGRGLIVTNHLVYEMPHTWRPQTTGPRHFDENGWLTLCACCRKVRDWSRPEKWDWVPGLVEVPHPRTTHGYCLHCLHFYYGDLLRSATPLVH